MKVLIVFYTKEPKPPEIYYIENALEHEKLMERIVDLTKIGAKFCLYQLDKPIGDFS